MKTIFFMLMMVVATLQAENITAIVVIDDSTAKEMSITSTTESLMSFVDGSMVETAEGEYIVIKQYVFTGLWIDINGVLHIVRCENPTNNLIGTTFGFGTVVGLYCPLTPRHIVNYFPVKY